MAKNELILGEPRVGWFVDGDASTDHLAVMLRDTGTAIELVLPLKRMFSKDEPYSRWWSSGVHFGDDPDRTEHSYKPPRVLMVEDSQGSVVLVGCRSAGSSSRMSVGQGHIVANFAVLGGSHLRYEKVNGLRTEIPALAAWTRMSSMEISTTISRNNRVQSVQMTLTSAEPVPLARPLNLVMRSSWHTERPTGGFVAYEGVQLETLVDRPRSWSDHLAVHTAILELVSIAGWKPFGIEDGTVHRADDPLRSLAGGVLHERWLPVATHRLPEHRPWKKDPSFLFPYSEIGPRGVARWLKLRRTYGQVVKSMINILRSSSPWGESSVVQSGIALEALGYLIDVNKNAGANLNRRKQMNFKPGLRVILADMKTHPLEDVDGWIERADAAYMSAKHLDRTAPDSLEVLNTLRENLLVLRFWVALELGAKPKSLMAGLKTDRLGNEFVPLE